MYDVVAVTDAESERACLVGQECTAALDLLAKSIQYGVFGFTFDDFSQFCL